MAATENRKDRPTTPEDLALLEIARGRAARDETTLPPGRRDDSGFWYPAAYRDPKELFTPHQRSMQAKQRQVQKRRREADVPEADADRSVPMPAPLSDALAESTPAARHARGRSSPETVRTR